MRNTDLSYYRVVLERARRGDATSESADASTPAVQDLVCLNIQGEYIFNTSTVPLQQKIYAAVKTITEKAKETTGETFELREPVGDPQGMDVVLKRYPQPVGAYSVVPATDVMIDTKETDGATGVPIAPIPVYPIGFIQWANSVAFPTTKLYPNAGK